MNIYLAGPINGCTDDEAVTWREEMKQRMPSRSFLDPMRRDYRGIEDQNVESIVNGDIDDIDRSNLMLANCWRPSFGTAMEVYYAKVIRQIPVIVWTKRGDPVSPWLVKFSDYRVTSALEAESVIIFITANCEKCGGCGTVLSDPTGVSIMRRTCPVCR